MKKRLWSLLLAVVLVMGLVGAMPASAASNPYPYTQDVDNVITRPCTWFCWQLAYERMGVELPGWGNAGNWLANAQNSGYSTGSAAAVNSIAVYSGGGYGHVAYVTAVNGNEMTVDEAGRTDRNGSGGLVYENGIAYGQPSRAVVGEGRGHGFSGSTLIGFIYLGTPPQVEAYFTDGGFNADENKISTVLTVSGTSISSVTSVGVVIYDPHDVEIARKEESVSYNTSYMNIWYTVGSGQEINIALQGGTTYKYKYFCVIGGKVYTDMLRSFTPNGSGAYLDVNGVLDGSTSGTLGSCGTVDVYINGKLVADDVNDYYLSEHCGAQYEIKDIKAANGYRYTGLASGSLSGTINGSTVNVVLKFDKKVDLAITTQPKNVSVKSGETASITVAATGENLSYQWQVKKSGSNSWAASEASGNQTATVKPKAIASNDGSQYRCVITDGSGNQVISNTMTLRVTAIATQPKNLSVKAGDATAITVKASGPNLSYQWQVKKSSSASWVSSTASGSKTATVKPKSNAGNDGYQYRCVITDGNGKKITSNAVTFHVTAITTQPKAASVKTSAYATFTVKATGSGLKYQWQYLKPNGSWTNCTSATKGYNTATLKVQGVTGSTNRNGYKYRCVITDANGNKITSNAVTLSVLAIKTQPTSAVAKGSGYATFTVKATGSGLKYQWQYLKPDGSWTNCTSKTEGYNTATLKVQGKTGSTNRSGYQYRCVITDGAGNKLTSSAAILSVR